MFKGWQQREKNARERIEAQAELQNDPEYRAQQAARQAHLFEQEEAARLRLEAERLARQGPADAIAKLMAERLGDVAQDVLSVLTKSAGRAKVVAAMEREAERQAAARQVAEREERAASIAAVHTRLTEEAHAKREAEAAKATAKRATDRETGKSVAGIAQATA